MKYILDKNYNSLDRLNKWDNETQTVIKKRLTETNNSPVNLYLTKEQGKILKKIIDILIYRDGDNEYVDIALIINQNLSNRKEGVRYGKNPWRGQFYKDGLALIALDFSRENDGALILSAENSKLEDYIKDTLETNGNNYHIRKFLAKVLFDAVFIYYSYPVSWNKIGFPGPAYPEGYSHLGCDEAEKWEPKYIEAK